MNVAQLIEELKKLPPDMPVVIYDDHTGDMQEVSRVDIVKQQDYVRTGERRLTNADCVVFEFQW